MQIHPTALIEDGARLASGCVIHAYAVVRRHCELAEGVVVHPFAVVGGDPQDLSFDAATPSGVRIGPRSVIREHVTVSRATKAHAFTEVGADCFLMASCHVAHDCRIGEGVIIANAVLMAGHVHVGDRAILGGGAVIHQFTRIGESAMIGGGSRIGLDIPPFSMAVERNSLIGLNVVGMRRRGFKREVVEEIKAAFRAISVSVGNPREIAASALRSGEFVTAEARTFLEFFQAGRRGFPRVRRASADEASEAD